MAEQLSSIPYRPPPHMARASSLDVYLLGLAFKLGGCVAAWHNGFRMGFWEYFTAAGIISVGYLSLSLCIAEMVSVIAFPGGFYGYVRCGIGPFLGFLVGCSGLIETVFYLAVTVLKLSQACVAALSLSDSYQPVFWFLAYVLILGFHIRGGKLFWTFMKTCTVISAIIILIYLFGSIPFLDFNRYVYPNTHLPNADKNFNVDGRTFLNTLRLPGWFFVGIDMITLSCEEVKNAKEVVPWTIVRVVCTMIVLAFWLIVTVAAQAPGITPELYKLATVLPLSFGFSHIFGTSKVVGHALVIVPLFSSCVGFMFAVGRQLNSMARSGLFPPILKQAYGPEHTPMNAMLLGTLAGMIGLFSVWRIDPYTILFRLAMMGGCVVYMSMFITFCVFKTRYSHLERGFTNPLGFTGAILGFLVFFFIFISLIRNPETEVVTAYVSYMAAMVIYYYAYADSRQFFSVKEQQVFLKAYVMNYNQRKKQAIFRRFSNDLWAFFDTCRVFSSLKSGRQLRKVHLTSVRAPTVTTGSSLKDGSDSTNSPAVEGADGGTSDNDNNYQSDDNNGSRNDDLQEEELQQQQEQEQLRVRTAYNYPLDIGEEEREYLDHIPREVLSQPPSPSANADANAKSKHKKKKRKLRKSDLQSGSGRDPMSVTSSSTVASASALGMTVNSISSSVQSAGSLAPSMAVMASVSQSANDQKDNGNDEDTHDTNDNRSGGGNAQIPLAAPGGSMGGYLMASNSRSGKVGTSTRFHFLTSLRVLGGAKGVGPSNFSGSRNQSRDSYHVSHHSSTNHSYASSISNSSAIQPSSPHPHPHEHRNALTISRLLTNTTASHHSPQLVSTTAGRERPAAVPTTRGIDLLQLALADERQIAEEIGIDEGSSSPVYSHRSGAHSDAGSSSSAPSKVGLKSKSHSNNNSNKNLDALMDNHANDTVAVNNSASNSRNLSPGLSPALLAASRDDYDVPAAQGYHSQPQVHHPPSSLTAGTVPNGTNNTGNSHTTNHGVTASSSTGRSTVHRHLLPTSFLRPSTWYSHRISQPNPTPSASASTASGATGVRISSPQLKHGITSPDSTVHIAISSGGASREMDEDAPEGLKSYPVDENAEGEQSFVRNKPQPHTQANGNKRYLNLRQHRKDQYSVDREAEEDEEVSEEVDSPSPTVPSLLAALQNRLSGRGNAFFGSNRGLSTGSTNSANGHSNGSAKGRPSDAYLSPASAGDMLDDVIGGERRKKTPSISHVEPFSSSAKSAAAATNAPDDQRVRTSTNSSANTSANMTSDIGSPGDGTSSSGVTADTGQSKDDSQAGSTPAVVPSNRNTRGSDASGIGKSVAFVRTFSNDTHSPHNNTNLSSTHNVINSNEEVDRTDGVLSEDSLNSGGASGRPGHHLPTRQQLQEQRLEQSLEQPREQQSRSVQHALSGFDLFIHNGSQSGYFNISSGSHNSDTPRQQLRQQSHIPSADVSSRDNNNQQNNNNHT